MSGITTSMTDYMKANPKLKYLFFGGKGGVGKTIMAGASALWFAKQGKKTLLASTNPVHSLSNLLNQDVFGKPVLICDEKQCFAEAELGPYHDLEDLLEGAEAPRQGDEAVGEARHQLLPLVHARHDAQDAEPRVRELAVDVFAHRVVVDLRGGPQRGSEEAVWIVRDIVERVPVPL